MRRHNRCPGHRTKEQASQAHTSLGSQTRLQPSPSRPLIAPRGSCGPGTAHLLPAIKRAGPLKVDTKDQKSEDHILTGSTVPYSLLRESWSRWLTSFTEKRRLLVAVLGVPAVQVLVAEGGEVEAMELGAEHAVTFRHGGGEFGVRGQEHL